MARMADGGGPGFGAIVQSSGALRACRSLTDTRLTLRGTSVSRTRVRRRVRDARRSVRRGSVMHDGHVPLMGGMRAAA